MYVYVYMALSIVTGFSFCALNKKDEDENPAVASPKEDILDDHCTWDVQSRWIHRHQTGHFLRPKRRKRVTDW